MRRRTVKYTCRVCGKTRSHVLPDYCSQACNQKAYRRRQAKSAVR